jgi:uncharacterized protein YycO
MPVLTAVYARSHTIGGLLIRNADLVSRRWSHCGICTDHNTVIEALAFKGVVETPWAEFVDRYSGVTQRTFKEVQCRDPEMGQRWARTQIGKGYDYLALLGITLGRTSWQQDKRWHCSEFVESVFSVSGARRFLDHPSVISPNLSYMVI